MCCSKYRLLRDLLLFVLLVQATRAENDVEDCIVTENPVVHGMSAGDVVLNCRSSALVFLQLDSSSPKNTWNRTWQDYKVGFGSYQSSFYWLGLEVLQYLSARRAYALRIDMWDLSGEYNWADFRYFSLSGESDDYTVAVDEYVSEDKLSRDSGLLDSGMSRNPFSTWDHGSRMHCASQGASGWWYSSGCNGTKLTGNVAVTNPPSVENVAWFSLRLSNLTSLSKVEMLLVPMVDTKRPPTTTDTFKTCPNDVALVSGPNALLSLPKNVGFSAPDYVCLANCSFELDFAQPIRLRSLVVMGKPPANFMKSFSLHTWNGTSWVVHTDTNDQPMVFQKTGIPAELFEPEPKPVSSKIRLVGSEIEGDCCAKLEIAGCLAEPSREVVNKQLTIYDSFLDGIGAVPASGITDVEANIACYMAGYNGGVLDSGQIIESDLPAITQQISCSGSERILKLCTRTDWALDLGAVGSAAALKCQPYDHEIVGGNLAFGKDVLASVNISEGNVPSEDLQTLVDGVFQSNCPVKLGESVQWVAVDLAGLYMISSVDIHSFNGAMKLDVTLGDSDDPALANYPCASPPLPLLGWNSLLQCSMPSPRPMRWVKITYISGFPSFTVCEIRVYVKATMGVLDDECESSTECDGDLSCREVRDANGNTKKCSCNEKTERQGSTCVYNSDFELTTFKSTSSIIRDVHEEIQFDISVRNIGESVLTNASNGDFTVSAYLTTGDCSTLGNGNLIVECLSNNHSVLISQVNITSIVSPLPKGGIESQRLPLNMSITSEQCYLNSHLCGRLDVINPNHIDNNVTSNVRCSPISDIFNCRPDVDIHVERGSRFGHPTTSLNLGTPFSVEYLIIIQRGINTTDIPASLDGSPVISAFSSLQPAVLQSTNQSDLISMTKSTVEEGSMRGVVVSDRNINVLVTVVLQDILYDECEAAEYMCVVLTSETTGLFTDSNLGNNIFCEELNNKRCKQDIAASFSLFQLADNSPIIANLAYFIPFIATVTNLNDTIDISEREDVNNFAICVFFVYEEESSSNISIAIADANFVDGEARKRINASSNATMTGNIQVNLTSEECLKQPQMCAVLSVSNASFNDLLGRQIKCLNTSESYFCEGLPIENPMLSVSSALVETPNSYEVSWDQGSKVFFNVSYGNGTSSSWNSEVAGHSGYGEFVVSWNVSHWECGRYDIEVDLHNDVNSVNVNKAIFIYPEISDGISIEKIFTPKPTPVNATFVVSIKSNICSGSLISFPLVCSVDYGDSQTSELSFTLSHNHSYHIKHQYLTNADQAQANITCSNMGSVASFGFDMVLAEEITNLDVNVDGGGTSYGQLSFITLTVETGSAVTYSIDFGDGATTLAVDPSIYPVSPVTISHNYSSIGQYDMIVTAFNRFFNMTKNCIVHVEQPIDDLTLEGTKYLRYPSTSAVYYLTAGTTVLAPTLVQCIWELHHEVFVAFSQVSCLESDTVNYEIQSPENVSVVVTCFNHASSKTLTWFTAILLDVGSRMELNTANLATTYSPVTISIEMFSGTGVSFHVDYGDGVSQIVAHSDFYANASLTILEHIYQVEGNFTVSVNASNRVSYINNATNEIIVQNTIENLNLSCGETVFFAPGEAECTLTNEAPNDKNFTDLNCLWQWGLNGATKDTFVSKLPYGYSQTMLLPFTITDVGTTSVVVNCSNLVSYSASSVDAEVVLDEVILERLDSSDVLWNSTSQLELSILRKTSQSCFVFSVGDDSDAVVYGNHSDCEDYAVMKSFSYVLLSDNQMSITHSHRYNEVGEYTAMVLAFNHVSNMTVFCEINVLDWPCEVPHISLLNDYVDSANPKTWMRSEAASISPNITINCTKSGQYAVNWNVKTSDGIKRLSSQNTTLYLEALSLEYGSYKTELTVLIISDIFNTSDMISTEWLYFIVTPTALVTDIDGPEDIGIGFNKTLQLDGISASYDPDMPRQADRTSGLIFSWCCKRDNESWFDSDGRDICTLPARTPSTGGCFGNGPGRLAQTGGELELDTADMGIMTQYDLLLTVSKGSRSTSTARRIYVGLYDPPVMEVKCRANCKYRKGMSGDIIMGTQCLGECSNPFGGITYQWSLSYCNESTNTCDEYHDFANYTLSGTSSRSLFIRKESLRPGIPHRLTLTARTPFSPNATVYVDFLTNLPPYGGECAILPEHGIAGKTLFKVECSGWKEWKSSSLNAALKYEYQVKAAGADRSMLFFYGDSPSSNGVLFPLGNYRDNFAVTCTLMIIDSVNDFWQFEKNVQVVPPDENWNETTNRILQIALSVNTELSELISGEHYQSAINYMFSLTSMLNLPAHVVGIGVQSDVNSFLIMGQARSHFLQRMITIPINSSDALDQVNELAFSLLFAPDQVLLDVQEGVANYLFSMAGYFNSFNADFTWEKQRRISHDLVETTLQLMKAAKLAIADIHSTVGADVNLSLGQIDTINSTASSQNITQLRMRIRPVMETILTVYESMKETMLIKIEEADPTTTLTFDQLTLHLQKAQLGALNGTVIDTQLGGIEYPVYGDEVATECFISEIMMMAINPYSWSSSSDDIGSIIADIRMRPCKSSLGVGTNTTRPRNKRDVSETHRVPEGSYGFALVSDYPQAVQVNDTPTNIYRLLYHSYNISEEIYPLQIKVAPATETNLEVYVLMGDHPTPDNFLLMFNVSSNKTDASSVDTYIPSQNLTNGTLWLGVRQQYDGEADGTLLTYEYQITEIKCQHWSDMAAKWLTPACEVENPIGKRTRFRSNLMGSFGTGLFRGPNTIDFGSVFDDFGDKLLENIHILAVITTAMIVYIPLVIICRRKDKIDRDKWLCLPLVSNYPDDTCTYDIHVYTGSKKNAMTDSKVFIRIQGDQFESGIRLLYDGQRKNFRRGDISSFTMTTPSSLGNLIFLKVWHDNSGQGSSKGWLLSKIIIVDKTSNKWYVFMSGHWLAADEGDGKTERILYPSSVLDDYDPNTLLESNMNTKFYDDHLWLSVAFRKRKSNFTRVQRLSCCLMILFLAMVCNATWYNTDDSSQTSAFSIGAISITVDDLYASVMSSLMVVPPSVAIALMFAKSRAKDDESYKGRKCLQRGLPHYFVYIAWVILVLGTASSAFFTMLFSFQWGGETSKAWLVAFLLSFLQSVLLIQPIKVIIVVILWTFIFKEDSDVSEFKSSVGDMPVSSDSDRANPIPLPDWAKESMLSADEVAEIRHKSSLNIRMRKLLKEILSYLMFFTFLLIATCGFKDTNSFYQVNFMAETVLADIDDVVSSKGALDWVKTSLIPSLFTYQNYNGQLVAPYDAQFMSDTDAYRLGPPQLRQIRVKRGLCSPISSHFNDSLKCTLPYSSNNEDKRNYLGGWDRFLNSSSVFDLRQAEDVPYLTHRSSKVRNGSVFWGKLGAYPGGGYIANLGSSLTEASSVLDDLIGLGWADMYTRVIFVEFNIWTANTNLLNTVAVSLEFPPNGGMFYQCSIQSVILYRYAGAAGVLVLVSELILLLAVLVMTIVEVRAMVKTGAEYWRNKWNISHVVAVAMCYCAMGLYVKRSLLTMQNVENMMNNPDAVVNFLPVAYYDCLVGLFLSLSCFLTMIRFIYILRYCETIAHLLRTMTLAAEELFSMAFVSFLVYLSFTLTAANIFADLEEYSSPSKSLVTMAVAFLGKFDFGPVMEAYGQPGGFFLLVYLIVMMMIMVNLLISLLNIYMERAKDEEDENSDNLEVIQHLVETCKAIFVEPKSKDKTQGMDSDTDSCGRSASFDDLLMRVECLDKLAGNMEVSPVTIASDGIIKYLLMGPPITDTAKKSLPDDLIGPINNDRMTNHSSFDSPLGKMDPSELEDLVQTLGFLLTKIK